MKNFQRQFEQFEAKENDINRMVDIGRRNLQIPGKEVEIILRQCTEFKEKYASDIKSLNELNVEMVKIHGRYKTSKKALKLEEKIKSHSTLL